MLHALKLVWNRKASHFLILCELLGALLVLFAVAVVGLTFQRRLALPLGFDYQDVWQIRAAAGDWNPKGGASDGIRPEILERELMEQSSVIAVGRNLFGAYIQGRMQAGVRDAEGRSATMQLEPVGLDFQAALDLSLVAGRWLGPEDEVPGDLSLVINRRTAERFFGNAAAAVDGRLMDMDDVSSVYRVVGVIEDFRSTGELGAADLVAFYHWEAAPPGAPFLTYLVEVEEGAGAAEEEALIRRLQAVAPSWTFEFDRLTDLRDQHLRSGFAPLAAGATVAVFLLLMVGLGLTGVLWQSITRRTREIGLRRAQGATRGAVRAQIVFEMLVLATLGIGLGGVLLVQIPLFGAVPGVEPGTLPAAFALAAAVLYAMTAACAYYPGLLASRIQPAAALHHE